MQYCGPDVNDIGQVNVAFSRTDRNIDVTFKSVQSLNDEEQVKGDDEDDCITSLDIMSFSWQIARGMVSEKLFVLFIVMYDPMKPNIYCDDHSSL